MEKNKDKELISMLMGMFISVTGKKEKSLELEFLIIQMGPFMKGNG